MGGPKRTGEGKKKEKREEGEGRKGE